MYYSELPPHIQEMARERVRVMLDADPDSLEVRLFLADHEYEVETVDTGRGFSCEVLTILD